MRKKLIPIITALIIIVVSLCGCSCVGSTPLAFKDNFNGGNEAGYPYAEKMTYNVEYVDGYKSYFNKSSILTKEVLDIKMNGEYVVELKVLDRTDPSLNFIQSDILSSESSVGESVYKLTANLELETTYSAEYPIYQDPDESLDEQERLKNTITNNEYIRTEVYFLSSRYSFNPLYSKTEGYTSYVSMGSNSLFTVMFMDYSNEFKYNKYDYNMTATYAGTELYNNNYGYTFKTAIDNNTLLFALRNIDLEVKSEYVLPTVNATYGSPQDLLVTNKEEREETFNVNNNDEVVKVKEYTFVRNVTNATGSPQIVLIQRDGTNNLANRALLMQYISPLSCSNTFICLGGLQYKLKTIN